MDMNKLNNLGGQAKDSKTLMPAEYVRAKHQTRANIFILLIFAVVMSGVLSAFVLMRQSAERVANDFDRVTAEYAAEQEKIVQLRDLESQRAAMIERAELASALVDRVPRSVLLGEVTRGKPEDMVLTEIDLSSKRIVGQAAVSPTGTATFDPKAVSGTAKPKPVAPRFESTLTLEGNARVNNDVADYLANLKQSVLLSHVELDFIKEMTVGEERLRQFKITARVAVDADASLVEGVRPFDVERGLMPGAEDETDGASFAIVDEEG